MDEAMHYRERLWPSPLGWAGLLGFAVLCGVALWPVGVAVAVGGGLAVAVALLVGAAASSPLVEVRPGELVAGRARIDLAWLGDEQVLDRTAVRAALGPGSDARAYVVLRAWLPGAVTARVLDPADPTPSWLVSSRAPERLVAAMRAARGAQAAHSEQIG